ncbi:MAG: helix-turn-helix domain-containing protein [Synechococcaceae cyanobacterium]
MPPPLACWTPRRFDCNDIEVFASILGQAGMELELLQLRPGPFRGRGLVVPLEHIQVVQLRLDQPVLALGAKPQHCYVFSLSLAPIAPGPVGLQAHGQELPERAIYGLDPHREVHLVTPNCYSMALLRVERSLLLDYAERLGCPELERPLEHHNWLKLDPLRLADLRSFLGGLFRLARRQPELVASVEQRRRLTGDLLPLVLESLVDGVERRAGRSREPTRLELVKQVEAWARRNPTTPITLEDLCTEVYASRRSLMRGFREHLGMGPMAFLKLRRLHGVHSQLLLQEPGSVRVQDLAAHWGFHNAGHFAHDYRSLFGERPLDTLRRVSQGEASAARPPITAP